MSVSDVTHVNGKTKKQVKVGVETEEEPKKASTRCPPVSCCFLLTLTSTLASKKHQTQGGPISDYRQRQEQDKDKGNGCVVKLENRALEAHAGDKQIDSHRRQ